MKIIILILIVLILIDLRMQYCVKKIKRIDEDGALYEIEYRGNYHHFLAILPFWIIRTFGCTAFMTHNEKGEIITGRNYDMPHFTNKKELTGLNAVIHLSPKGKYKSVNVADLSWLSYLKMNYVKGILDTRFHNLWLIVSPYLCMDGINEKGLTCSILYLDVKKGEKPTDQKVKGLKKTTINEITRNIIDSCATCEEAIALVKQYNLHHVIHSDFHLFISDLTNRSVVLEWRYNELKVTEVDACTNFYVGYDDAEDCYYGEDLKEKYIPARKKTRDYHYGYGHGYERFFTVTDLLDQHIIHDLYTQMKEEEVKDALVKTSQEYNGMMTSYTQYSCIYNQNQLSLDVYVQMDYQHKYSFKL